MQSRPQESPEGIAVMDKVNAFISDHRLKDEDDIEALVDMASLVRELIGGNRHEEIGRVILHTVQNGYFEAFSWCMEILQEEMENPECPLEGFDCTIGRAIPDFDAFMERLQVDFRAYQNDLVNIYDQHGEAESIVNILLYKTKYPAIQLVSFENFDTKDNDYVQYKLAFSKGK